MNTDKNRHDIFISFSNADRTITDSIVEVLQSYDIDPWYQINDSKLDFVFEINNAIKDSLYFVVFISHQSINSIMVRNEINRALGLLQERKDYKIVPIIIEELSDNDREICSLLLGSFNWLFLKDFKDYRALVESLLSTIGHQRFKEISDSKYKDEIKDIESQRIRVQSKMFSQYSRPVYKELLEESNNALILDFGCGEAHNIMATLEGLHYKGLLGVDINPKSIQKATKKYQDDKVKFIVCNILENDIKIYHYLSSYNQKYFDIINISSVLLHIKEYKAVLLKLKEFLKDGGRLVVLDEDDDLNIVYPEERFFKNAFYIYDHSFLAGNRHFAKRLPILLLETGYRDIKLKNSLITSIDFNGEYREALWDLYFNPSLWSTDRSENFDTLKAFDMLGDYITSHDHYKKDYMNKHYFIGLGIMIYTAKK